MKLLSYHFGSGSLQYSGDVTCESNGVFHYETRTFETLKVIISDRKVTVEVPFFLAENIFYTVSRGELHFWTDINELSNFAICPRSQTIARRHGFLPLSRTRFSGVEVLCSWVTYTFDGNGVSNIEPSFPACQSSANLTTKCKYELLHTSFRERLKRDCISATDRRPIVLLSGGIDSRLLLSELLICGIDDILLQNHGMPDTGDHIVAKKIADLPRVKAASEFNFLSLESFDQSALCENYRLSSGFLEPMRLLYFPSDHICGNGIVFSGLYGDVVFGRKLDHWGSFSEYCRRNDVEVTSETDRLLITAYDGVHVSGKLYQVLLRCQKLTRMSFPLDQSSKFSIPFLDNDVLGIVCDFDELSYPEFIRRFMPHDLSNVIHQSSLSRFTASLAWRLFSKIIYRVSRSVLAKPYFKGAPILHNLPMAEDLDASIFSKNGPQNAV